MGSQSNPITPHETWLELFWSNSIELCIFAGCISISFYRLYSIKSFSGRFIFLHLRTSPRSDFPGSHGAKKHYRLVLFWARALQSFYFLCFLSWRIPCNEPETSRDWTHKYHKTALLFITVFRIEHSVIYFIFFLLSNFLSVICLFWHTLTARDDTRTRQHTRQGSK